MLEKQLFVLYYFLFYMLPWIFKLIRRKSISAQKSLGNKPINITVFYHVSHYWPYKRKSYKRKGRKAILSIENYIIFASCIHILCHLSHQGSLMPSSFCSQPLESFSPNWLSPFILQHPGTNCKVLVYKDSSSDGQSLWFLASRLNCTHRKCLSEPGWRRLQTLFPVPFLSTPAINSKNDPAPDPMM